MYKMKKAFTLAEIIVVMTLLGVVAAIVIPNTIQNVQNKRFVVSAKKTYAALETATEMWMVENGCQDEISICFDKMRAEGIESPHGMDGIIKYLNIVESTYYIGYSSAVGTVRLAELSKLNWLPERSTLYNGNKQQYAWQAVSKYGAVNNGAEWIKTGLYLFADGTTMSVQMPDNRGYSGFGFFDVNGRSGPNKVGVDIYPFGFGMPGDKNANVARYGYKARSFNPYFVEDDNLLTNGMCDARKVKCSNDDPTNPTEYLLNHGKVPNK